MLEETIVELQNDRQFREQAAGAARRLLERQADVLALLEEFLGFNGDGRLTWACRSLLETAVRLRTDTYFQAKRAEGMADDDIPF